MAARSHAAAHVHPLTDVLPVAADLRQYRGCALRVDQAHRTSVMGQRPVSFSCCAQRCKVWTLMNVVPERLLQAGFDCFSSLDQWQSHRQRTHDQHVARWQIAQHWQAAEGRPHYDGYCELCDRRVRFSISAEAKGPDGTWYFRDDAVCDCCRMMARLRLGVVLMQRLLQSERPRIYVNEQISPLYSWLLRHHRDVIGSEYAPDLRSHDLMQRRLDSALRPLWRKPWHRLLRSRSLYQFLHQDATALKFATGRFNVVLSFDVLEHIPDYRAALREFARVLQPGGYAILTAPFLDDQQQTCVRARLQADGGIEHLLPPEYHGDPMAEGNQILCYQIFGWDLLDDLRAAGFSEAWTVYSWNPSLGFPSQMPTWVARK